MGVYRVLITGLTQDVVSLTMAPVIFWSCGPSKSGGLSLRARSCAVTVGRWLDTVWLGVLEELYAQQYTLCMYICIYIYLNMQVHMYMCRL